MKKTVLSALALAACAVLGASTAAQASGAYEMPASSETNKASYWGEGCVKVEFGDGVSALELWDSYDVVVVKAGRTITVYEDFWGGEVSALSGKDISHIIWCPSTYSGS